MTDPADVDGDNYLVLVNAAGQHSLWPAFAGIPDGWVAVHGPGDRTTCLEYVNEHWTDLRPRDMAKPHERSAAGTP